MNLRPLMAPALLALVLGGCASSVPLYRAQIGQLTRDSTPDDLDRVLGKATPRAQFELQDGGKSFAVRTYALVVGSRQEMMVVCTPNCMAIPTQVPVTADFAVIQALPARTLLAWGTLEELSKDADPGVSSLMPPLKQRLAQLQQK